MEHVLRSSLLAGRLAERVGLDAAGRATVYYTNLVMWIGCHADSHEVSRWFGDDIAFRRASYDVDWSGLPFLRFLALRAGSDRAATGRSAAVLALLATPRAVLTGLIHSHCLSAGVLADRLGLGPDVADRLRHGFERWDGGGLPTGCAGTDIPVETRIVQLAEVAEVHLRRYGTARAVARARSRSGGQFDPELVAIFATMAPHLDWPSDEAIWQDVLDSAPGADTVVSGDQLDTILEAMGDFADLKCVFTLGHSRAVAALAAGAAERLGLPAAQVRLVRRAGYVHDLGRMGVPNSVWERRGPLSESDRERVRLHPYYTGRILSRVRGLEQVTLVAEAHHERQDGSGYPRGLDGGALGMPARVLAAADSFRTSLEQRPHRPALSDSDAVTRLRGRASEGALDPTAVEAVLAAHGGRPRRRQQWPAQLTAREAEVLRLLAAGRSNREIAETLSISGATVRHHIEHIYAKISVSNRTGASLFAMTHGIVDPQPALSTTKDGSLRP
jgi:HD-GYP domain-containing protein (c-di-GMP phosphodiesterase class II)